MTKHEFVPSFPVECVTEIISIVRSGQINARKWELAQHAAWFIGCASARLEQLVGPEDDVQPGPYSSLNVAELSTQELCDKCQELTAFGNDNPAKFDIATWMMVIKLVIELVKRFQ